MGAVWISRLHAHAYFMAVIIFLRCLNAASVASYKWVDRLDLDLQFSARLFIPAWLTWRLSFSLNAVLLAVSYALYQQGFQPAASYGLMLYL